MIFFFQLIIPKLRICYEWSAQHSVGEIQYSSHRTVVVNCKEHTLDFLTYWFTRGPSGAWGAWSTRGAL